LGAGVNTAPFHGPLMRLEKRRWDSLCIVQRGGGKRSGVELGQYYEGEGPQSPGTPRMFWTRKTAGLAHEKIGKGAQKKKRRRRKKRNEAPRSKLFAREAKEALKKRNKIGLEKQMRKTPESQGSGEKHRTALVGLRRKKRSERTGFPTVEREKEGIWYCIENRGKVGKGLGSEGNRSSGPSSCRAPLQLCGITQGGTGGERRMLGYPLEAVKNFQDAAKGSSRRTCGFF